MSHTGGAADDVRRPTGASGDVPTDALAEAASRRARREPEGLDWVAEDDETADRPSVLGGLLQDLRVRVGLVAVAALAVGLLVGGLVFGGGSEPETGQGPTVAAQPVPTEEEPAFEPVATVVEAPRPTRITIPDLGIDQGFVDLTVSPEGKMGVPSEWMDIGWWADGPAPGEPGGAIVAGHVNGGGAPAVFAELPSLAVGAQVVVTREDASTATYVVRGKEQFAKDDFPDARVYTFAGPSFLHLVTCGGTFDRRSGHYDDNIVVFAELVSVTPA